MAFPISRRALLAAAAAAGPARAGPEPSRRWPREVLAFYYGWWGLARRSGAGRHWTDARGRSATPHLPARGLYDSLDPADVAWQVRQALEAGVTGFVASWWGPDRFEDSSLGLLLRAAEGTPLKVCAYYETVGDGVGADLDWLARRWMGSPAWLRVDGRPVLFVFDRVCDEAGPWSVAAAVQRLAAGGGPRVFTVGPATYPETRAARASWFDALHAYSILPDVHDQSRLWLPFAAGGRYRREVAAAGRGLACVPVSPGYDDRKLPDRPGRRPVLLRRDGATYRVLWEAAVRARPDWVLITSWNEWHEGTEIEPSLEHGDRELATTRRMAGRFLQG